MLTVEQMEEILIDLGRVEKPDQFDLIRAMAKFSVSREDFEALIKFAKTQINEIDENANR
jgi:hypothetical protein